MSYRCGIGEGLAKKLGIAPGPPMITCDRCSIYLVARTKSGGPPAWLLNNRAPPGWELIRHEDPTGAILREDYCPACRAARRAGA